MNSLVAYNTFAVISLLSLSGRRKWHPTPVLWPGEFHGWRSLVGYSPRDHKQSGTTERLHFLSIVAFVEGNGNPLQCSCLEKSIDRGDWWTTVHTVSVGHSWSDNTHTHTHTHTHGRVGCVYLGTAAAAAESLQSCPTLCDPIDSSPPGSPVPGILQARTLEWVVISFSNSWKWKVKVKSLSRVRPSATPWTAAFQSPPTMGFSRQEYWSGVPLPCNYLCIMLLWK